MDWDWEADKCMECLIADRRHPCLDAGSSPRRLILDAWGWIEISAWGYRCLAYCSGHIFSDVLLLWYIHSSTFARVLEFVLVLVILHCFPVSCFYLRRRGSLLVFGFFVNWQHLEAQTVSISDGGRQCPHHNKKSSDRWSEQHFFPLTDLIVLHKQKESQVQHINLVLWTTS